jgi:histidinol-phosphate aminotransferase
MPLPFAPIPPHQARGFVRAAAELYGFDPSWIIMANGSDEVLNNLIRACAGEGEEIGYVHPSYSYYSTLAEVQGAKIKRFSLTSGTDALPIFPNSYDGRLFFLTSPNAPLGFAFPLDYIEELADPLQWPAGC